MIAAANWFGALLSRGPAVSLTSWLAQLSSVPKEDKGRRIQFQTLSLGKGRTECTLPRGRETHGSDRTKPETLEERSAPSNLPLC